jgi:ribosome biogenesis GTPase
MSHKLTKRQVKSLKKQFEHKDRRAELKARRAERQAERAARKGPPPRQRDWLDGDGPAFEPVRRKASPHAVPIEASPAATPSAPPPEAIATVIEVHPGDALVSLRGRTVRAALPPDTRLVDPETRSPLAVGDRVQLEAVAPDVVRIVALLPRRSALVREVYDPSRRSATHVGQVMAANIDQVFVVCSPVEPPFRPRLIDRYLVAASRDGLPVVICLNKTDLGVGGDVEAYLRAYERLGCAVARTSAVSGQGLGELRARIAGKVSLFTGHSGVGKSSLLNALEPGLALRVGSVTEATAGQGKGRHTTSSARLVPLSLPDTFVVDSPGIRAFGVRGLAARALAAHFPDIDGLAGGCAYRDCLHRGEHGCAVAAQAERDAFLRERLASYRTLLGELS